MAEGGGGEVVLTDLEEVREKEEVVRKESGGRFTLGAEDGDELLGEMEFTIRHTQATPYKVGPKTISNRFRKSSILTAGGSRHRACTSVRRSIPGRCPPSRSLGWSALRWSNLSLVEIIFLSRSNLRLE